MYKEDKFGGGFGVLLLILECGSESQRLSILQISGCHITGLSLLLEVSESWAHGQLFWHFILPINVIIETHGGNYGIEELSQCYKLIRRFLF
jgi:hypothetical protein